MKKQTLSDKDKKYIFKPSRNNDPLLINCVSLENTFQIWFLKLQTHSDAKNDFS